MEKIEKNLVDTKRSKHMIKATNILDITLEDYHQSRVLYGSQSKTVTIEKKDYNLPRQENKPNNEK